MRTRRTCPVLDAERADVGPLRLGRPEFRPGGMEHPDNADRLAGFNAKRHDILDLEVHRVTDPHAVAQSVLSHLDRRALDAQNLTDQRRQRRHGPAKLSAENPEQLPSLLVGSLGVDEQAEAPVALRHHLRRVRDNCHDKPADVGSLHIALGHVEDEGDAAPVVIGAVREGKITRAHKLARARLEVGPLHIPRHAAS